MFQAKPRGKREQGADPGNKNETEGMTMTMLAKTEERASQLGLADYEARIRIYKEQAVSGFLGIGRTLNEAKASGVVPHGEWESWVERTTGMAIRQAQRCMQAAQEITPGSALERLDMSKAILLLSSGLDAEQQEALAGKAAEDGASVRALKEEIRRLKLEKVQEAGAAAEIRTALRNAESERDQLKDQMAAAVDAVKEDAERRETEAFLRGASEQKQLNTEALTRANNVIDRYEREKKELERQLKEAEEANQDQYNLGKEETDRERRKLQDQVEDLLEERNRLKAELKEAQDGGERLAAEQKIRQLQRELEAAEEREAKKARELAELRKEKTQARMDAARGIRADAMSGLDLAAAVRAFIGQAGTLPQMGQAIAGMSESERDGIRAQVETVAEWVRASRAALGTVVAEATVV